MLRIVLTGCAASVLFWSLYSVAAAQRSGMRAGGQNFGGAPSGIGGFGSSGFGRNGFGSSGFGGSGFGGSGFGGGMGGAGFGSPGFGSAGPGGMGLGGGGGSAFGGQGFGGQAFGSGFGGQSGPAFVGRDSTDMEAVMNQMNRNNQQMVQQFSDAMARRGRGRQRGQRQAQTVTQPVRVRLDVGFAQASPAATTVATNVRRRLERILANRDIAQPEVTVEGGTVVLRGVAATPSQRTVIERLVAMEPGVTSVSNQMTVAPAPSVEFPPAIGN